MKEVREEEAVSEVVGTILVLAITVALFGVVFAYVENFPHVTPSEQISISSEITFNPNSHVLFENLSDQAGGPILRSQTFLLLRINNVEYSTALTAVKIVSPYVNSTEYLVPGDTIIWNSSSLGILISNNSTVESYLFYKPTAQFLWQQLNILTSGISLTAFYVTPNPIQPNDTFTIVVQVSTFNPKETNAYLNLSSLYGTSVIKTMDLYLTTGTTASFYYTGISPSNIPVDSFASVLVEVGGISIESELRF